MNTQHHKNTLKIHVETIHEKYTRFGCKICEYVAPHNSALKTMLYLGILNPNHQNVVYASTNLASIKKHEAAVHDKKKSFQCRHCPHSAFAKGHLQ